MILEGLAPKALESYTPPPPPPPPPAVAPGLDTGFGHCVMGERASGKVKQAFNLNEEGFGLGVWVYRA